MVATKRLKLALEMDEKRKARLEKIVATTHLRLALETEEERRAKNGLDLIWIEIEFFKIQGMSLLALQWEPFF